MKKILVTGATGCIGSNLIVELLRLGYDVRAFHRPSSNTLTLKGVNVERLLGNILNKESLREAMDGCDAVFHTAALVTFWKRERDEQFRVNVHGTKNVVETCLDLGIEKLVHISTIAALGYRTDNQLIDERTTYNWGTRYSYRYTKHLAELEVLIGVEEGLNATIVNPSIVIGPRDINAHGGTIVREIKRARIPFYPKGGINVVSVRDIVEGIISAAKVGRNGERYILGGINLTNKEVFELAAKVLNGKAPKLEAPTWLVKTAAKAYDIFGDITGIKPSLTSDLAAAVGLYNWYSSEKAKQELGYQPTPIEDAMKEAYEWYEKNGMI